MVGLIWLFVRVNRIIRVSMAVRVNRVGRVNMVVMAVRVNRVGRVNMVVRYNMDFRLTQGL